MWHEALLVIYDEKIFQADMQHKEHVEGYLENKSGKKCKLNYVGSSLLTVFHVLKDRERSAIVHSLSSKDLKSIIEIAGCLIVISGMINIQHGILTMKHRTHHGNFWVLQIESRGFKHGSLGKLSWLSKDQESSRWGLVRKALKERELLG